MKEDKKYTHKSVMVEEVLNFLNPKPGGIYVDCTVGEGGHAFEILKRMNGTCCVIGIDRDDEILERARKRLKDFNKMVKLVNDRFSNLDVILDQLGISSVDGFLFDLGLSSFQIENENRGFSFKKDEPLDMRMDKREMKTAYEIVNKYSKEELTRILKDYGGEPLAERIAYEITRSRPLRTTEELANLVVKVYRRVYSWSKRHPATRTFQALRIAVNDEIEELKMALRKTIPYLKIGGRVIVISFHSVEDGEVKRFFKNNSDRLKIITRKPLYPKEEEIKKNPRARSAKMRVAEKRI